MSCFGCRFWVTVIWSPVLDRVSAKYCKRRFGKCMEFGLCGWGFTVPNPRTGFCSQVVFKCGIWMDISLMTVNEFLEMKFYYAVRICIPGLYYGCYFLCVGNSVFLYVKKYWTTPVVRCGSSVMIVCRQTLFFLFAFDEFDIRRSLYFNFVLWPSFYDIYVVVSLLKKIQTQIEHYEDICTIFFWLFVFFLWVSLLLFRTLVCALFHSLIALLQCSNCWQFVQFVN